MEPFEPSVTEEEASATADSKRVGPWFAPGLAAIGGLIAIPSAIFQEGLLGDSLMAFTVAPMVEEAVKPIGVYLLLAYWPHLLRSQRYTALLCALAGLVFGLLESTIYVTVYFPGGSASFVTYRYIVNPVLHAVFSYIFGNGINQRLKASAWGEMPFMSGSKKFFVWAMALHATYNLFATALY